MKKNVLRFLGILVSLSLLYLLFRDIDFGRLVHEFLSVNYMLILLGVFIYLFNYYFRAMRWKQIIKKIVDVPPIRLVPTICVSYAANNILPLRAGEFVRAYHGGQKLSSDKAALFSTVIVERVVDVATLFMLLLVGICLRPVEQRVYYGAAMLSLGLIAGIVSLMLLVRFSGKIIPRLPLKLQPIAQSLTDGFKVITSLAHLVQIILSSWLIWFIEGVLIWIIFFAFGIALLPVQVLFITIFINLSIIIPSTPGNLGVIEWACVLALTMFGIEGAQVIAAAFMLHMAQYIPVTIIGLSIMLKDGVNLKDAQSNRNNT